MIVGAKRTIAVAALWACSACYGGADDDAGQGETEGTQADTDGADGGSGGDDAEVPDVPPSSVPEPLAPRLTDLQYVYTIEDVLDVELSDEERQRLPRDIPIEGKYSTTAQTQFFNTQYVLAYAEIARSVSERLDTLELRRRFGDCEDASSECIEAFANGLGLRLFRRPLEFDEAASFVELFGRISMFEGASVDDAIRGVLQAMLQSPGFLYRLELETEGEPGSIRRVSGWELASRLSYFIWQSAPDAELLAFARGPQGDGRYDEEGLQGQIERMLGDPKAARSRDIFWGDYSLASISAFASVDAETAVELERSLLASFERLSGVDAPAKPLTAMFTDAELVMTPVVAEIAGATPKGEGLQVYRADEAEQRQGLLTHPGLLAAIGTTSFVGRGLFLTERILCQHIAPPPAEVSERIMETNMATEDMTPREASEYRLGLEAVCLSCHTQFEPIAYAFERYDVTGRFTLTDDQGRELYSHGVLPAFQDRPEIVFETAPELLEALSSLEQIRYCFTENMMEFATGFSATPAQDSLAIALGDFEAEGMTFEALVRAVAENRQLTLKRVADSGE